MLKLRLLTKKEEFEELKKKQLIIVKWKEGATEYIKGNGVREYRISEITGRHEVILQKRGNIYFNYIMYLNKESNVEEVYRVVEEWKRHTGGGTPKGKKEFKVTVQNLFGIGYFTGKIYRHEGEKAPAIGEPKIYKNKKSAIKAVERILDKTGFLAEVEEIKWTML